MSVKNSNYCATVSRIVSVRELENCSNVKAAMVLGNQVIVSKDSQVGDLGIFFPLECRLSFEYLSYNNLYRHEDRNVDNRKKGYFEDNGRLRAVRFRGHKSEGLFMPLSSVDFTGVSGSDLEDGYDFDELNGIEICRKYEVERKSRAKCGKGGKKGNGPLFAKRLLDGQFRLHVDTEQLKKNIHMLRPDDVVSITSKLHGTSAVFGNVMVKKKVSLWNRIGRLFGFEIVDSEYDLLYSSRKVIKNDRFSSKRVHGFYDSNVWEHHAGKLKDVIEKGMSLYGEIVGYTSSGSWIQRGYHYGCGHGESRLYVYRITMTNADGRVIEFDRRQIDAYCERNGLTAVPLLYYGKAVDVYPDIACSENWHYDFLERLSGDSMFGMNDSMCALNNNEVPAEGVVVRVERLYDPRPYKLKNYAFLEFETKMLDDGAEDLESEESFEGEAEDV